MNMGPGHVSAAAGTRDIWGNSAWQEDRLQAPVCRYLGVQAAESAAGGESGRYWSGSGSSGYWSGNW